MATISSPRRRPVTQKLIQLAARLVPRRATAFQELVSEFRYWLSDVAVVAGLTLNRLQKPLPTPALRPDLSKLPRQIAAIPGSFAARINRATVVAFAVTHALVLVFAVSQYGSITTLAFPTASPTEAEINVTDSLLYRHDLGTFLEKATEKKVTVMAQMGEFQAFRETKIALEGEDRVVTQTVIAQENGKEGKLPAPLNMKTGDRVGKELAVANKMDYDIMTTVSVEVVEDSGLCSGLTGALYAVEEDISELLIEGPLLAFDGGLQEQWAMLSPNSMKRLRLVTWLTEQTADDHQGQTCTIEQLVQTVHLEVRK